VSSPTPRNVRPVNLGAPIRRHNGRLTAADQAQAALEIALYEHSFDTVDTLAWIAAGAPENGASQADRALYEAAKSIVRINCGSIKPGDSELILSHVLRQHRLSRQGDGL
jgi:hypothetical protein